MLESALVSFKEGLPYIYKIIDTRNGMELVGKHAIGNKNYFTSSIIIKNIIKKNGGLKKAKQFLHREIVVQGNFNDCLLNELEKHYIRFYNTKTPNGYNLTDGGDGNRGYVFPKHIIDTRKPKPFKFKIGQFDINDSLIKIWDNVNQVAECLNLDKRRIYRLAKGNLLAKIINTGYGGFKWKYIDFNGNVIEPSIKIHACKGEKRPPSYFAKRLETKRKNGTEFNFRPSYKPINQYSLSGEFIAVWNSKQMREKFNLTNGQLQYIIYGLKKNPHEHAGFLWKRN